MDFEEPCSVVELVKWRLPEAMVEGEVRAVKLLVEHGGLEVQGG